MFFINLLITFINSTPYYILTPKGGIQEFMDVNGFAQEHNAFLFASIEEVSFYKIKGSDYKNYKSTLSSFFNVEREQVYTVNAKGDLTRSTTDTLPWHLGRIAKKDLPLESFYKYSETGSCHQNKDIVIDTYVIDTGIDVTHPEFEGRAVWLNNFADSIDTDCHSHGTHCAGLVGSKTFGVCKDANLFAIKVLDCDGSGSTSSVISGISYAYKTHLEKMAKSGGKVRSIVSMSLGGGYSRALNLAVKSTLKGSSFYFAAAAGNENDDACNASPSSVKEIFTVMASDRYDNRASFSNYGECADIYSPGVNIMSTIPDNYTAVYSGTSMATPILVGVLNHYLDLFPNLNMKNIKQKVLDTATKYKLKNNPEKTLNLLAYLDRGNDSGNDRGNEEL